MNIGYETVIIAGMCFILIALYLLIRKEFGTKKGREDIEWRNKRKNEKEKM